MDNKEQLEFEEAVRPLIKYLNDNHHPHMHVIVTSVGAELSECVKYVIIDDYLKD